MWTQHISSPESEYVPHASGDSSGCTRKDEFYGDSLGSSVNDEPKRDMGEKKVRPRITLLSKAFALWPREKWHVACFQHFVQDVSLLPICRFDSWLYCTMPIAGDAPTIWSLCGYHNLLKGWQAG